LYSCRFDKTSKITDSVPPLSDFGAATVSNINNFGFVVEEQSDNQNACLLWSLFTNTDLLSSTLCGGFYCTSQGWQATSNEEVEESPPKTGKESKARRGSKSKMEGDLLGIGEITGAPAGQQQTFPANDNYTTSASASFPDADALAQDPAVFIAGSDQPTIVTMPPLPPSGVGSAPIPPAAPPALISPSNLHSSNAHSEAYYTTPYSYDQMITDAGAGARSSGSNAAFLKDSIDSFLPALTARHTLPDRTVASQVLMYRQLLHTACKPGLRLSRAYQGTPAQKSVMFMPWYVSEERHLFYSFNCAYFVYLALTIYFLSLSHSRSRWEKNVAQTKRMVISYDNLTSRLWIYGAILPFVVDENESASSTASSSDESTTNSQRQAAVAAAEEGSAQNDTSVDEACEKRGIDCMINKDTGLPPIPHAYWVSRAGFQQDDPLTDFRSGGVLSLALLLHICESCPVVHARFIQPHGDASVLPFGITSINVTGMLARLCNFSKAVDKVDALMTAKPFWEGFRDPNFLLTLQETSMELLADVVVELNRLKKWHLLEDNERSNLPSKMKDPRREVTVFDFPDILETAEKRVRDDLLGAGPRTVEELRQVCQRLRVRYARACDKKERALIKRVQGSAYKNEANILGESTVATSAFQAMSLVGGAAEGFFSGWGNNKNDSATRRNPSMFSRNKSSSRMAQSSNISSVGMDQYQFAQPVHQPDEQREPSVMSL
jgi:hypothetical protein